MVQGAKVKVVITVKLAVVSQRPQEYFHNKRRQVIHHLIMHATN